MVSDLGFPHRHPPASHQRRQAVVDSFMVPPALQDADFVHRVKGTFAYQLAELQDHGDVLLARTRAEFRRGLRRSRKRRPW